jgi:hypothetical protein
MAQQILGSLQNIEIDVTGLSSYKNLVCLRTSSVNTTVDSTTEQTNCGPMTSVANATMSLDFDAICEVAPTVLQISYEDLLVAMKGKIAVSVRVQSPVFTGSSAGAVYYHQFLGYITSLTFNQSTTEFINFSGTITSTGDVDVDVTP